MSSYHEPNRLQQKIDQTAELLVAGAHVLNDMLTSDETEGTVPFKDWAAALREIPSLHDDLTTSERLVWLWETLREAPDFADHFGTLPPAAVPWTSKNQRFDVFLPGEWFVVGMKGGQVAELLQRTNYAPQQEDVSVQTKDKLRMKPGKGDRLECCDCHAEVTIRVNKVFDVTREADIMRIEEDRIELEEGLVKVQVDSLNQAYTVSSRRLEPERRSHGGRTYDHIVHARKGTRTRLEDIRRRVESGTWKVLPPATPEQQIECMFQEPEQWGLRGDPYLWRELKQHLLAAGLPDHADEFGRYLESKFEELVGVPLSECRESVFVDRYAHGGMSSGHVDPDWWRRTGIPLLQERFTRRATLEAVNG